MEPAPYEYPKPRWVWWEYRAPRRAPDEKPVTPRGTWRRARVPASLRELVEQLGRASNGWAHSASIDVDEGARRELKALRDQVDPGETLGEVIWKISGVTSDVARLCPFEACADSRAKPPHRRSEEAPPLTEDDDD